jgi:hypothetical protein
LTCPTCRKRYIGQIDSSFKTRYREHFRYFKHVNRKSRFAQHLLDNGHSIGPIEYIMETIHVTNKGQMMDTLEKFHISRETKLNNQINDKVTVKPNIVSDVIIRNDPPRRIRITKSSQSHNPHLTVEIVVHDSPPQRAT